MLLDCIVPIVACLLYFFIYCVQGQKKQGRNERKGLVEEKKKLKEAKKLIAVINICSYRHYVVIIVCCLFIAV